MGGYQVIMANKVNQSAAGADIPEIYRFLDELRANNNREWFSQHKSEYEKLRAGFISDLQDIINMMADRVPSLRYLQARDCMYRIYRDTRFSSDKTPFKTHFSALISPWGRHTERAAWYLHIGSVDNCLAGGIWCPESALLRKLRKAVIDNVEEFRSIIDNPELISAFPDWTGPQLKTAPKGYDRNHPDIDLLRLTAYCRESEPPRSFFEKPGWKEDAARRLLLLTPMIDFINYSIDE